MTDIPINLSLTVKRYHNDAEALAAFICSVSREDIGVDWYKDGCSVLPSNKYEFIEEHLTHSLIVHDLCQHDYGEYIVVVGRRRKRDDQSDLEAPIQFIVPLQESTCQEGESVTFVCELSEDDVPAKWLKDGKELVPSDDVKIEAKGKVHKLTLKNVTLDDRAEYTIKVKDKESTAPLFVEEEPLRFVVPLREKYEVAEGDSVRMICEINKPNIPAMWLKDGEQITIAEGYNISVDGCRHILSIPIVDLDHDADYTIMIGDLESSTQLFVEEVPVEFTHRLKDSTFQEGEMFELSVELSKPDVPVRWMKNKKLLSPSDRIKILCERYRHVLQIMEAIPEDEGEYTLVLPDNSETSANITIKEIPAEFKRPLSDINAKETDNITLECELSKLNTPVTWLKDGKEITPDDRVRFNVDGYIHQLLIDDVTLDDKAKYSCVCGDVSTEATLSVEELPLELIKPLENTTITEKQPVTLECEFSKPNKKVVWKKDGKELRLRDGMTFITDKGIQKLVINSAELEDKGEYSVEVDGISTTANLNVKEAPLQFIRPLQDTQVMERSKVILECEVSKPDQSAVWYLDDEVISGSDRLELGVYNTVHQLIIETAKLNDEGRYTIQVQDQKCSATLLVDEFPVQLVSRLHDVEIARKGTAKFECEASIPGVRPKWYKDEEEITISDGYDIQTDGTHHYLLLDKVGPEDVGTYTVKFDDEVHSSCTLTLKELPLKITKPLEDKEATEKESVTLNCEVSKPNVTAKWFKDNKEILASEEYKISDLDTVHTLTIKDATLEDAGTYKCCLEDKETKCRVKVKEEPLKFVKPLSDLEVKEGETIQLECVVSKNNQSATWLKDNKALPVDNRIQVTSQDATHTLTIKSAMLDDEADYIVKIGDISSTSGVFVEEEKIEFIRKLEDIEVKEIPCSTIFECELSKPDVPAKWFLDGKPLTEGDKYKMTVDGTVHRLQINDIDGEDEGDYSIVVRGKKSEGELIVEVPPSLFLDKSFEEEVTLKAGQSTAFEIPFKGNPQPKATWLFNDQALPKDKRIESETIYNMSTLRIAKVKRSDVGTYKLTLENSAGKVAVAIKLNVLDKPSAPQDLAASDITAESVKLTWQPPSETGGSDITGYLVEKREANRRAWQEVAVVPDLTIIVPKLLEGNQYFFRVSAKNDVGTSDATELKEAVLAKNPFDVPDAPDEPSISDVSATSCKLSWQPPANDGGSPVIGYHVERMSGFSPRWIRVTKDLVDGTELSITDLVEGNTYDFRVLAENAAGLSKPSQPSQTIRAVNPWTKPEAPGAPEITGTDKSSAALKWSPPEDDGGAPILGYHIEQRLTSSPKWTKVNDALIPENTFSVAGLKEGAEYEFRVIAENKAGTSPVSKPSKPVKIIAPVVGVAPKLLEKLEDLTVIAPQDAILECDLDLGEPEAEIKWFKGQKEVKKGPKYEMSYEDEVAALTIHETEPADADVYSCQATNVIGQVQTDGSLTIHTHPKLEYDNKLKSNQIIKAGSSLTIQVNISGIPSPTIKWLLDKEPIDKSSHVSIDINNDFTTLTIKNASLEDGGVYNVTAENVVGSAEAEFTIQVKDKPGKPKNLKVVEVAKDSVSLSWEPPTETGNSDIDGYIIEKRDAKRNTWTTVANVDGSTNTFAVQKLLEGNEYYFRVAAKNEIGLGEPAELDQSTVAKCPFDVPGQPRNLEAAEITKSQVTLTWDVPEQDGGSPITGYIIERSKAGSNRWLKAHKKPVTDTVYTVTDLVENSDYDFRVAAENEAGIGKPCQPIGPIKAKDAFDKPDAPGKPEISDVTKTSVTLTWTPPEKDGGDKIFNYVIEYKPSHAFKWLPANRNINVPETTFTLKDLTEGMEYEFRVSAENRAGVGPASLPSGVVVVREPISGEAPSVLEGLPDISVILGEDAYLECKISGQPEPSVSWSKDSRKIDENKKYQMMQDDMTVSMTIREVTQKDAGSYSVEASNDLGSVSTSGQLEIQMKPELDFDNKFRDLIVLQSGQTLRIPVSVSGLPKPEVTWRKDDTPLKSSGKLSIEISERGTAIHVKKVSRSDDGLYHLTAQNEAGEATANFDVEVIDVPASPEGPVEYSNINRDSVTLSWKPPLDDGGSKLLSYIIEKREASRSMWAKCDVIDALNTSYTATGLTQGKEYHFRISAMNDVGSSEPLKSDQSVIPKSRFGMFDVESSDGFFLKF